MIDLSSALEELQTRFSFPLTFTAWDIPNGTEASFYI
jgi:hypothetical protein